LPSYQVFKQGPRYSAFDQADEYPFTQIKRNYHFILPNQISLAW